MTEEIHQAGLSEGERKVVTALVVDLKGSTELMESLDPEDARAIIDPALEIMLRAVRRYGGYVVQSTGDGIFAIFGAPLAFEDHPQRALHASLEIQRNLRECSAELLGCGSRSLQARLGITTGEVVMRGVETGGRVEYSLVGITANLAARLQMIAPTDSIVTSEATRKLVEGYFELRSLGPVVLKGITEPVTVYEVLGPGPLRSRFEASASRGFTKFVGRGREVQQMNDTLELAMVGRGQVLEIVGEAGAGKSRLLHEFKAGVPSQCKLFEACPVSYGRDSAYAPALELLYKYFGIEDRDRPAERRQKIRANLNALDPAFGGSLPYLFAFLGIQETSDSLSLMDSQVKRRRTLEVITRIVLRESQNQPLVLIFEDLHWIDIETQELIEILAGSIAESHVLLLVTYRPEYQLRWTRRPYYSQIRLGLLNPETTGEMLSGLLGENYELATVKRIVIDRAGGNPFFVEELVQALLDQGVLVRNGTIRVRESLSLAGLPPTVQGVLASRIDRLAPEQKEFLQTLAVIGKELPLPLVQRVAPGGEVETEAMLARLQETEFIFEDMTPGEIRYAFKHSVTQEAAYNSLLRERRKQLHQRVAAAMESLYAQRLENYLGELAHHYQIAGNTLKAIEYLGRAGQQAAGRSAHAEACALLKTALELLRNVPETPERAEPELRLLLALGTSLQVLNGWSAPELSGLYQRARALCQESSGAPQLFPVLTGLMGFYVMRGELQTARNLSEQLLSIAKAQQHPDLLLRAHAGVGFTAIWPGEVNSALSHLEHAASLCEKVPRSHQDLAYCQFYADLIGNLALTLSIAGHADRGADLIGQAVSIARETRLPFNLAMALHLSSAIHSGRGAGEAALRDAEEVIGLASEHGFQLLRAYGICWRGAALVVLGIPGQGVTYLREGLASVRSTGSETAQTYWMTMMVAGQQALGLVEEGLATIAQALAAIEKTGERIAEAEVYRLKAELLLMTEDELPSSALEDEAEQLLQQAIYVARGQGSRSWELSAAITLARLLNRQGRREEAYTILAQIYSWFSEGFDTRLLKEASTLLDDLRRGIA